MFQSRICDDISPPISHDKLFHLRLKNLSLLACESKLQDFSLFQKKCVIPHIHSIYHGYSPTKPKMSVVWVRKDFLRWVLSTCPWFNSFNYLWTCLLSVFGCLVFSLFWLLKKKIQKHWKFYKRQKYFVLCLVLFFLRITWIMIFLSWFRMCLILWRNIESMCCITKGMSYLWFCISMY